MFVRTLSAALVSTVAGCGTLFMRGQEYQAPAGGEWSESWASIRAELSQILGTRDQSPVTSAFSLGREFRCSLEFKSLGTRCQLVGFASIPISNLSVWSKKLRNVLQLHLIYNEHVPDEIDCLRVLIRDDLHPRLRISSVHWRFCRGNKYSFKANGWRPLIYSMMFESSWFIVDPNKVCKMTKLIYPYWVSET